MKLAAGITLLMFGFVQPSFGQVNSITVRIHNYAQVPSSVLRHSEQVASSTFREAGLNVSWVECTVPASTETACKGPVTPFVLLLNLLPESMSKQLELHSDAFGVAAEATDKGSAFFASVFYDKVKDCATHQRIDLAPFLGSVMAHELGHLLLGSHSHSAAGLMRANWSGKELHIVERSGLSFSSSEISRLQSAMVSRSRTALSDDTAESVTQVLPDTKSSMR